MTQKENELQKALKQQKLEFDKLLSQKNTENQIALQVERQQGIHDQEQLSERITELAQQLRDTESRFALAKRSLQESQEFAKEQQIEREELARLLKNAEEKMDRLHQERSEAIRLNEELTRNFKEKEAVLLQQIAAEKDA